MLEFVKSPGSFEEVFLSMLGMIVPVLVGGFSGFKSFLAVPGDLMTHFFWVGGVTNPIPSESPARHPA